ncbi:odorant receptor 4-like [Nymphalis io]|uniref:odorant receptor 4-like n=1 Tax=Inachis io TaxID=171585 RepID=UPI002167D0BF|nr:odorant receptor 4-like [Nymphalis io]
MLTLTEVSDEEYQEYATGIIDPQIFYKHFYELLKFFQVLDAPIPKWTYLAKILMVLCAISAQSLLSLSIYHGVDNFDLSFTTEAGTYFIVMSYKLLILACTKLNIESYHSLQRSINEDFMFVCNKGEKYRKFFFYNQIQTRKICKLAMIFTVGIGVCMIAIAIISLVYYLLTHDHGKGNRPLLFPFWAFDTDFGATPTYEIAFIFSNTCVSAYAFNYIFMVITQIIWIREIAVKADIVILCIHDLLDGIYPTSDNNEKMYFDMLIKNRMKKIIKHHHSMITLMEDYAKVYKKLLLFEQKITAPVVCLSAYSATEKLEMGELNAILMVLCIGATVLTFVPSYLCTYLSMKVSSICYACWDIPFWNANPVIRPYLILIMQRSLRPLPLNAPGFEEVSVQTFSKKMASAYSFFNMLRQANI